jgi:hypothetical protein
VVAGQVVLSNGVEPLRETLAVAVSEHGREGPDVTGKGVELGALVADGLELELFGLGEGFRASEDPSGDRARRRRPGGHRSW